MANEVTKLLSGSTHDYDNASKRYKELTAEADKIGKKALSSTTIPVFNPNWGMTEVQAQEYRELFGEYKDAKTVLDARVSSTGLPRRLFERRSLLDASYNEIIASGGGRNVISDVVMNKELIPELTSEELINLAKGQVYREEPVVKSGEEVFEVVTKNGKRGFVKIQTRSAIPWRRTEYQMLMNKKMIEVEKMLADNVGKYAETQEAIAAYPHVFKASDKGLVRAAGLKRHNGKIVDLEYNIVLYKTQLQRMKQDKKLLELLKLETAVPRRGIEFSSEVQSLMAQYGVSTPKEAYETLKARISLVKQYDAGLAPLQGQMTEILGEDKVVSELSSKIKAIRETSPEAKELKIATQKIIGKFGKFIKIPKVGAVLAGIGAIFAGGAAVTAANA